MQELRVAGREMQDNNVVFRDDVESLDHINGSMEKYVKMHVNTYYTIKYGLTKPVVVTAKFMEDDLKLPIVDPECASCSGHKEQASAYEEFLFQALRDFTPGMLPDKE